MKNRRSFLAGVASGGIGLAVVSAEPALAQTTPSPAPSGSAKPASAVAVATAVSMKRFDPALTDEDVQSIAKAIDANNDAARVLNPKKKRLANGAAPAVHFRVPEA